MGMAGPDSLVAVQRGTRNDGHRLFPAAIVSGDRAMDPRSRWNERGGWRVLLHRQYLADNRHRVDAGGERRSGAEGPAGKGSDCLEALPSFFSRATSHRTDSRPHRIEEEADAGDLCE